MQFSRRKILTTFGVAASTVLLNNCASNSLPKQPFQLNAFANISNNPEIQSVRLGVFPSLEIAPLLVAKSKKLFAKYGMTDVELVPFKSWQDICDRTAIGTAVGTELGTSDDGLDGGHFYSPLPELMNEGLIKGHLSKTAMYVLMRLHSNGGYIVASKRLKPLGIKLKRFTIAPWQDVAKVLGKSMNSAIAELGSNYDLWLRYWLTSMNVDPNQNIDIIEIPIDEIIPQLRQHQADLLCLDSWNMLKLIDANLVDPAIAIGEIWHNYPGEIMAMRADWVDKYPIATQALIQATIEAQIWCDDPANAQELNTLLALSFSDSRNLISQPLKMFAQLFKNSPKQKMRNLKIDSSNNSANSIKYWSNEGISVSYPYKSHDLWFLTEYRRWNLLPADFETKATIDAVNREDLWKNAAKAIGVPDTDIPIATSRGIEKFFDGFEFDPDRPEQYLQRKAQ